MKMDDDEVELLLNMLEERHDLTVAEMDGIRHALAYLLGSHFDAARGTPEHLGDTEAVLHIANDAYPDWVVNIHGRANDRDGHWRCTLREGDTLDRDAAIGSGRSPVLSQAILSAVMRLALSGQKPGGAE